MTGDVLPAPRLTLPELDWLNKGIFVGGRTPDGVIYETYLLE